MRWVLAVPLVALAGFGLSAMDGSSAHAVAGIAGTNRATSVYASPLTRRRVPHPPAKVGCYRFVATGWKRTACDTSTFVRAHFPHPEVLSGIAGGSVVRSGHRHTAPPFTVSVISARPVLQQAGTEADGVQGAGAYSLQDNVFFKGTNKHEDGVQFTDQSSPVLGVDLNGICVWQVDIKTQHYSPTCASSLGGRVGLVEGTVFSGLLTAAALDTGGTVTAVVVGDKYGLGKGRRWNNSSGSILGYGGGSQAVFSNTEEALGMEVSSCLNDDGFIGYSVFCTTGKLKPMAYVSYSPGPSTSNDKTVETNNLIPVIGSPPAKLPKPLVYFYGGYTAQINYVATTTGHCWTGALPYCQ
jgi:hypothetical protein